MRKAPTLHNTFSLLSACLDEQIKCHSRGRNVNHEIYGIIFQILAIGRACILRQQGRKGWTLNHEAVALSMGKDPVLAKVLASIRLQSTLKGLRSVCSALHCMKSSPD